MFTETPWQLFFAVVPRRFNSTWYWGLVERRIASKDGYWFDEEFRNIP